MSVAMKLSALGIVLIVGLAGGTARARGAEAIRNWTAPRSWDPAKSAGRESGRSASASSPLPFVPLFPCRIADTRGNGFSGAYGPPSLAAGVPRDFPLAGQCRIPLTAGAVSLNVTVTNAQGPGFLSIYPQGSPALVSTLNYVAGQNVANAAVVAVPFSGLTTVLAGVSGADVVIDTNGFYGSPSTAPSNVFLGPLAGNASMAGLDDTGIGEEALSDNTTGGSNTAAGYLALGRNVTGGSNTALGTDALGSSASGSTNVAVGYLALADADANGNTAAGSSALSQHTSGAGNTAVGRSALTTHKTSNFCIGIGENAGINTAGLDNRIYIGSGGDAGFSANVMFIGDHSYGAFFLGGVSGASSPGGIDVLVTSNIGAAGGVLGTGTSSVRFKRRVREVGEESGRLMRLRPVAFRYRPEIDPAGVTQYGLVAEEVEQVDPGLVAADPDGRPLTVRYPLVDALLLDLVQKQRRRIEDRERRLRDMSQRVDALEMLLAERRDR